MRAVPRVEDRSSRVLREVGFVHLHVHSSYSLLEGALKIGRSGEARGRRQAARARADRHQQSLRRPRILRKARRHAASSRSPAIQLSVCSRSRIRPRGITAPVASNIVLLAQNEEGYRNLMRLGQPRPISTCRSASRRASSAPWLEPHCEGLIALTGGPAGPLDRALRIGPAAGSRPGAPRHPEGRVRQPALCRDPAPRRRRRACDRGRADRAGRSQRPASSSRRTSRSSPSAATTRRMTRCSPSRKGRVVSRRDRRRLSPEHDFKTRAADDGAVRRPAGRAAGQRRDRHALRLPGRDPQAHPAELRRAVRTPKRSTRARSCGARREEGLVRRLAAHGPAPGLTEQDYRDRLAFEVGIIQQDEIPRLLPDRGRLHQVGQGSRHPGRAGPRLRRRLARRLRAHHHGPRSAAVRPALRALPQSRTRLDAGLRHRLLRRGPRARDRVRAAALRRGAGRADHHLRNAAGPRRAARRRPRARDALRPGRQAHEARAAEPGQPGHARAGDRGRAEAAGGRRRGARRRAPARDRAEARRAAPARIDPRGRRGDRRPAARRNSCRSTAIRRPACA